MGTTNSGTKCKKKGQDMRGISSMREWPGDAGRWVYARIEFARQDDRGVETAEIVIWMAVVAGILATITGVLQDILSTAIENVRSAISDAQG